MYYLFARHSSTALALVVASPSAQRDLGPFLFPSLEYYAFMYRVMCCPAVNTYIYSNRTPRRAPPLNTHTLV